MHYKKIIDKIFWNLRLKNKDGWRTITRNSLLGIVIEYTLQFHLMCFPLGILQEHTLFQALF